MQPASPATQRQDDHEVRPYGFMLDEIHLLIPVREGISNSVVERTIDRVLRAANRCWQKQREFGLPKVSEPLKAVLHIPIGRRANLALARVQFSPPAQTHDELLNLVRFFNELLRWTPERDIPTLQPSGKIAEPDEARASLLKYYEGTRALGWPRTRVAASKPSKTALRPRQPRWDQLGPVAMPNWLAAAAPHGQGTGGPGTMPIPVPPTISAARGQLQRMQARVAQLGLGTKGANVTVAIFDSAPIPKHCEELLEKVARRDVLIERLLASQGGPLQIIPVLTQDERDHLRQSGYHIEDYQYDISAHGVFVASLIHMIAPQARLELYDVLDGPSGLWNVHGLINGILLCLSRRRRPAPDWLLVNLSLVLCTPPANDGLWAGLEAAMGLNLMGNDPLGWLDQFFGALLSQGHIHGVVASAGNQADDVAYANRRPEPQYPAACTHVAGVGSIQWDLTPAPYSNLSDTLAPSGGSAPQRKGYVSFGGERDTGGVIGVYVGDFPGGQPNDSGWAYWGGTSFAAPKVTGLAAQLLRAGAPSWAVVERELRDFNTTPPNKTRDQEEIVDV